MSFDTERPFDEPAQTPQSLPRRLFLREPGWRIGIKRGSQREFCYVMAPGQDFYHRLNDGELFVFSADERLCLACAERRGLLSDEPKYLPEMARTPGRASDTSEYDIVGLDPDDFDD